MPLIITNCVRTSKQLHVAQKGLASRYTETYILTTSGGGNDGLLDSLIGLPFTATGPQNNTKPYMRERYAYDTRFISTSQIYKQLTINTFQLDVEYTGYIDDGLEGDEVPPTPWSRLSRRCIFRNVQLWTYPSSLPTNYNAAWPPTSVISGTSVDMMGTPENYRVWHHTIEVEIHIDRSYYKSLTGYADYWPIEWTSRLFKRNSGSFLSYPAGTVVFVGFQQALTEDPWDTYTLSFEADAWGHLEQRVIPNVTGGVLMTNVSTWAGKPIKQADAAYWYQPWNRTIANSLYDLNLLAPGGSFVEITDPTPVWAGYP
jgi:hypothetical protein